MAEIFQMFDEHGDITHVIKHTNNFFTGPTSAEGYLKMKLLGANVILSFVNPRDYERSGLWQRLSTFCNLHGIEFIDVFSKIHNSRSRDHQVAETLAKEVLAYNEKGKKVGLCCNHGGFTGETVSKEYFAIRRRTFLPRKIRGVGRALQKLKVKMWRKKK